MNDGWIILFFAACFISTFLAAFALEDGRWSHAAFWGFLAAMDYILFLVACRS